MTMMFRVRLSDGTEGRKAQEDLAPEDVVLTDGPETTAALDEAFRRLTKEVEAAGGVESWRAQVTTSRT